MEQNSKMSSKYDVAKLLKPCKTTDMGPLYKTNLVQTKSLSDHGADQIWLCKQYLSVPKIWSGLKSGPKWNLLMCKDHGPIEFGRVPNLDM